MKRLGPAAAAVFLLGCSREPAELALSEDWVLVEPADDPWPDRPSEADCGAGAVQIEEGYLEVDTDACDWVTVVAPSRARVRKGDPLEAFVFHSGLTADTSGVAVLGLAVERTELWFRQVPIPSADGFYDIQKESPVAIGVGDELVFHVHNHGANAYRLGHLRRGAR